MRSILVLSCTMLLFLCSCQHQQIDPVEHLNKADWDGISELIIEQNPNNLAQNDSLILVRNMPTFPFSFYTYRSNRVTAYPVFEQGNAMVFGVEDAKLSLMVLPIEFNTYREAKAYAKDILEVAFSEIERTETGYQASNLDKKQTIDIGHFDSRYYLWLKDLPIGAPKESDSLFQQIRSHFRLVELTD